MFPAFEKALSFAARHHEANTVHHFSSFVDVMESLDGHKLVIDKKFAVNRIQEHLGKIEKLKADYGID